MNMEIGVEAAQFPEKEYINGIAIAVQGGTFNSLAYLSKQRCTRIRKTPKYLAV